MSFLLDTNVIAEVRRGHDANVRAWVRSIQDAELFLSVLTVGEIRKGIDSLRRRDPTQADVFATWLQELHGRFASRILAIDARIADQWGRLNAVRPRNTVDSLIAATAKIHQLTVVTRNTSDFQDCDVPLLNPWQRQSA